MKLFVPAGNTGRIVPATFLICLLAITLTSAASQKPSEQLTLFIRDSILIQKQLISKKHKIRLYPNANHEVLFFSANGTAGKVYQLFLFDVEGQLVKQVNIKHKQTTVINRIEKGNYVFEVFSDDERIENGQLIVR